VHHAQSVREESPFLLYLLPFFFIKSCVEFFPLSSSTFPPRTIGPDCSTRPFRTPYIIVNV